MRVLPLGLLAVVIGCGPSARQTVDGEIPDAPEPFTFPDGADAKPLCPPPPNPAGTGVELAAPYDQYYTAYDLGVVPGVPDPLGGTAVLATDRNRLLVAGGSEAPTGAIYSISVERDACDHIIGFVGTAQLVAQTPYVDANIVYYTTQLLLYTEWPVFNFSQLPAGAAAPARRTDLRTFGMSDLDDNGPGGVGIVPPNLAGAGGLRVVTWPAGRWFHVAVAPDGAVLSVTGITQTATLPNWPGGFAYVPAGSPGFTEQALIVAEWRGSDTQDRVVVYDVDPQGDPVAATRREFFHKFPRPWGAYFEPVTGDYLFLSWGTASDHVYIVQGFVPPPPIP